jgi:hypothetical protein
MTLQAALTAARLWADGDTSRTCDAEGIVFKGLRNALTTASVASTITRTIPALDKITPTTPLRLQAAAELGFPDGSMSAAGLRRMIVAGRLEAELICGRYYVTLAAIEDMRGRCRAKPKDRDSNLSATKTDQHHGSSETENVHLAQAAMNLIALEQRRPSPSTSRRNTTPKRRLTPRT